MTKWDQRKLGDVLTVIRGVSYKKEQVRNTPSDGYVPIIRATNIQDSLTFEELVYVPASNVSAEQKLRKGDIVIAASSGSRNIVGKAAQLNEDWSGSFGAFCFGLRPANDVNPRFVGWFLQTREYRNRVSELAAGVNINNLRAKHIEETPIRLPPLDEQQRIVAEIEKQFTRLDAGVASLKRVQGALKRYRASVLKAACEGRLVPTEVELARKEHRSFETGEQLLQRILKERREKWNDKGKYREPAAPDLANLPPIPEGWTWATLEQLNLANRPCAYGVLQPGDNIDDGVPFVRVGDINDGKIDTRSLKRISPKIAARYPRTKLQGGEFAITLVGAVGRTAIIPESLAGGNTARAVGIVPLSESLNSHWVELWFRNPCKSAEMVSKAHEVARKTLNLEDVRIATVALPPLAEQARIVAEVERRLSVVEESEALIDADLQRATRLRQAALQQAFEGKLTGLTGDDSNR